jgi:hypothetical protein
MGLSDIVVIDHQWHEEAGGFQNETTEETTVARRGNEYFKIKVYLRAVFGWKPSTSFSVTSEEKIAADEYLGLTGGKEILDTAEARHEIEEQIETERIRDEAWDRLEGLAANCPKCKSNLTAKSGKYGPFWGCRKYPSCDGTSKMSPEAVKLFRMWAGYPAS